MLDHSRHRQRLCRSLSVSWKAGDREGTGYTINISEDGAAIAFCSNSQTPDHLMIELELEQGTIRAQCERRWERVRNDFQTQTGVRFVSMESEDRLRLKRWLLHESLVEYGYRDRS